MNLYCIKCKYRFEKEKMPNRCPYCSAAGAVRQVESAQDLLDQVIDEADAMEKSKRARGV